MMLHGALMFGVLAAALAAAPGGSGLPLATGTADAPKELPPPPQVLDIEIEERLGQMVPLDVPLVDQDSKLVKLRDYLQQGRPIILTMNYYSCPTLCSLLLNAVVEGLRGLPFVPGTDYQPVTVSIDHREGPALAKMKRQAYLTSLQRVVAPGGWPFLTGREKDVKAEADGVGFRYRFDQASNQFAHAAGIFVLTPEGRISRVLYGIDFPARDLRLALVEASRGAIGNPVDRLLLLCYHYDSQVHKYTMTAMGIMRVAGVLTVILLSIFLVALWRRERRAQVVHE